MTSITKMIIALFGVAILAGCVEDDSYTSEYYSKGSGYVTTYRSDSLSGYNRDYAHRSDAGYHTEGKSQPQPVSNRGYHSAGDGKQ